MKTSYYNTDLRTFLISFQYRSTCKNFIFQSGEELLEILKTQDKTGIETIKEFDPNKGSFKRISKKDFLQNFSWETETSEYLKTHYFFK